MALDLADRLRQVPGIDAASIATVVPLRRSLDRARFASQQLYLNAVDPSYFPMMHLPVLQGRMFGTVEPDAVSSAISAARRLWPNESPLGKSCLIGQRTRTVTGVVKDSGVNLMSHPESVEAYTPIDDKDAASALILVHATANPAAMSGALRPRATLPGIAPQIFTFQSLIDRQLDTHAEDGNDCGVARRNRQPARPARNLRAAGIYGRAEDARNRGPHRPGRARRWMFSTAYWASTRFRLESARGPALPWPPRPPR